MVKKCAQERKGVGSCSSAKLASNRSVRLDGASLGSLEKMPISRIGSDSQPQVRLGEDVEEARKLLESREGEEAGRRGNDGEVR